MLIFLLACAPAPPALAAETDPPTGHGPLTVDCHGRGQFLTIEDALDAASSGDRIWVAPCTYYGSIEPSGKSVEIRSTAGASATTVVASPGQPVVTVKHGEDTRMLIQGFTLSGGGSALEPAIDDEFSSLTLREVRLTDNDGTVTVYNRAGRLVLDRVTIEGNRPSAGMLVQSRRGQALVLDSTVRCDGAAVGFTAEHAGALVDGSTFDCPGATGVEIYHSAGRVQRTVVDGLLYVENEWTGTEPTTVEDTVLLGGAAVQVSNLTLRNVVTLGPVVAQGAVLTVEASILGGDDCGITADLTSTVTTRYDDFAGDACRGPAVGDDTSFSVDPAFVDEAAGDYRLDAGSPCRDAGPDEPGYADTDGSRNDLGAFGGPLGEGG